MFVPHYPNVLVQVVAILAVINSGPATTSAHDVFLLLRSCAYLHILTHSVNLAFGPKSGFKNKCWSQGGFGLDLGFKMRPFCNSVWICMQRATSGMERVHPPPTNSKYRLKSFCEVGYANFRPNVCAAGKRISVEILVGVGLHA